MSARRRKKRLQLTPKQAFASLLALAAAFLVVVLLNEAIGSQLPVPSVDEVQSWVDGLSAQTGLTPAPVEVEGKVAAHFIDVGQGDCELIQTESQNVLVDAGNPGDEDKIAAYLRSQQVEQIDLLIATHPHADHIGGMAEIVQQFEIGQVLFAPLPDSLIPTTRTYEELLDAIAAKGLSITAASPGMTFSLGDGAQITILGPVGEFDDLNNASIVFRLDFGQTAFLFTGDAEAPSEDAILDRFGGEAVAAQVLKLGHHGSDTSSQEKWLNAVSPLLAVAEVGYDNSYGHPSPQTVERLDVREIPLLRTDQDGTIVVVSDGESLSVSTEK
ncbi:MAG TPA: MBL fold metallo-hydrolase [Candidatus Anaerotruncus excrementipullorum]|uniref:MBL fold metallo-hydrolase n=1 Tax=Candidatus Anaerotruncus excrementipullorum TaxID=2838465 RepID=A0A9D1WPI8_9FIRM|nr:MBL fold metallo-hydrolase [Candidatus Anaerotruncus excrementipullorum]